MSKKRIIIYAVLAFITLCVILFFSIPRVSYKYDDYNQGYMVNKVYGYASTYEIKSTYKGEPVISIEKRVFANKRVKEIIFEEDSNLLYIEGVAFLNCTNLKTITIPSSVVSIDNNAFSGCSSLESVIFEDGSNLKAISGSMFINCKSLSSIVLPDGITSIGTYAFFNCYSLKTITIPSSVDRIYNEVFYGCFDITINYYSNLLLNDLWLDGCSNYTLNIM